LLFHNFEALPGGSSQTLKNYGFISDAIFKKTCSMQTNHLATKRLLFETAELEIQLCAQRQGGSLASIADSVFESSLVNDSSANTAYTYRGSL